MSKTENLLIIDTIEGLEEVEAYLADKEFIAIDTETTGVERTSEVVGYSFAAEEDLGIYVVLSHWDATEKKLVTNIDLKRRSVKTFMTLKGKKLVMHNAVFDCEMIRRDFGIELMPDLHTDTMVLAHILDENRQIGLKPLAAQYFGETAVKEQQEMKESVLANGGQWTKGQKDMYMADRDLIAKYGAKDTILTLKLFNVMVPELFEQNLDGFFYDDESMKLLRGPTYQLNTVGLRVNLQKLQQLEREMEHEVKRLKVEILEEIAPYIKDKKKFNVTAPQQLAWLLFTKLDLPFKKVNDKGRDLSKELIGRMPYTLKDKNRFKRAVREKQQEYEQNLKLAEQKLATRKAELAAELKGKSREEQKILRAEHKEKLAPYNNTVKGLRAWVKAMSLEKFVKADKSVLTDLARKYSWIAKLLKMRAEDKLLGTYVKGIQKFVHYGVVYPSFSQTGTPSGRYASFKPNFQNLPRDDKRVKSCIEARPGKSFVGADQSQLEPRCFASTSGDEALINCFARGEDFYSVVGIPIFKRFECSSYKKDSNYFGADHQYPNERQNSKNVALAAPYGTTKNRLAEMLRDQEGNNLTPEQAQEIIDAYFHAYPKVQKMMLDSHKMAMKHGVVYNLYGRPRRLPEAKRIRKVYGNTPHAELPYQVRSILNLAMNFRVQSSGATIMNRAAIRFCEQVAERALVDPRWAEVYLVLQVHDELVAECPDDLVPEVKVLLKDCMENTTVLPGVALVAEPKAAKTLAELK